MRESSKKDLDDCFNIQRKKKSQGWREGMGWALSRRRTGQIRGERSDKGTTWGSPALSFGVNRKRGTGSLIKRGKKKRNQKIDRGQKGYSILHWRRSKY